MSLPSESERVFHARIESCATAEFKSDSHSSLSTHITPSMSFVIRDRAANDTPTAPIIAFGIFSSASHSVRACNAAMITDGTDSSGTDFLFQPIPARADLGTVFTICPAERLPKLVELFQIAKPF